MNGPKASTTPQKPNKASGAGKQQRAAAVAVAQSKEHKAVESAIGASVSESDPGTKCPLDSSRL